MDNEFQTPGYYAIITADVRYDKSLPANAKLLYGEIVSYCINAGFYIADIEKTANLYSVTIETVKSWFFNLEAEHYIYIDVTKNILEKLKNKKLLGFGIGSKKCLWCGVSTHILCNHHYPIKKENGGTKTVGICSNCHNEFHYMEINVIEGSKIYVTDSVLNEIKNAGFNK